MKLTLKSLRREARTLLSEENVLPRFREEIGREFGSRINLKTTLVEIAEQINDELRFQNDRKFKISDSILIELADHRSPEVRAMVVRLSPAVAGRRFKFDSSSVVRCALAEKVDSQTLYEMCRKFPHDDQLKVIREERDANTHEMYRDVKVGKQTSAIDELSDGWYESQATRLIEDHGERTRTPRTIERLWKEVAVKRYCTSMKATSGIEVDYDRLLKAVDEQLEKIDSSWERTENGQFKNLSEAKSYFETLTGFEVEGSQAVMPVISESEEDPIVNLSQLQKNSWEFVPLFEAVFNVKKVKPTREVTRRRLEEGLASRDLLVPDVCRSPSNNFSELVESVVDKYVTFWNRQTHLDGDVMKLSWVPEDSGQIRFIVELV